MTFPTAEPGSALDMTENLAEGVGGCAIEEAAGTVWVPAITAEREGDGRVGAFLDALPTDRAIKFPTVLSTLLAGMLQRRGFQFTNEGEVDIWHRRALAEPMNEKNDYLISSPTTNPCA